VVAAAGLEALQPPQWRQQETQTDLTTCKKGKVWDATHQKCVAKHSGVLPDPALTEYAFALAKAERYDEALEVLRASNPG
jgi:hypothetical protein